MTLSIFTSTITDGSMKALNDTEKTAVTHNQTAFLEHHGLHADDTTYLNLTYDRQNFCDYVSLGEADKGDGMTRPSTIICDGLVSTQPGHALLLPLADCIGAVIHDPEQNIVMLSHLGRHNLEQHGGEASVRYLIEHHGSDPHALAVWLSPAAGQQNYPLFAFENRSLHEVAIEQLIAGGMNRKSIDTSPIDTTTNEDYFSHSEFLKGHRSSDGRFAVVAVLR